MVVLFPFVVVEVEADEPVAEQPGNLGLIAGDVGVAGIEDESKSWPRTAVRELPAMLFAAV